MTKQTQNKIPLHFYVNFSNMGTKHIMKNSEIEQQQKKPTKTSPTTTTTSAF